MTKYTIYIVSGKKVIKRDDGAWIPTDEGNRDYRVYLDWVAEGNKAEVVIDEDDRLYITEV